ncbi:Protein N-acetyltransferase, RimJ/RimL family [Chitinophaga sp. YR573]|uniref:GNAT family N-acetyltransferase n=1 Tax=Chitinophaga sp. YR573 TaxID=1881040 RepID=UPI0008BE1467|nr:GNAT family N-acetyltransferase [Chitinophaga sp. YR573]SEW34374.1 Protein N-acetyltransferase, RimJ/RimL family [Chitinophaga sp. YR573]
MLISETERLSINELTVQDAPFVLTLLNTPTWLRFIGDRGIKNLDEARNYLLNGPIASYKRLGFGLYLIKLKEGDIPVGMSGLIKRDGLDDVDVGFALHPDYTGKGYAFEATAAVMTYAREVLKLNMVVAITTEDNTHSISLLQKIGLHYKKMVTLPGNQKEYMLFSLP